MTSPGITSEPTTADHLRGRVVLVTEAASCAALYGFLPLRLWAPHTYTQAALWTAVLALAFLLWAPHLAARWRKETRDDWAQVAGAVTGHAICVGLFLALGLLVFR